MAISIEILLDLTLHVLFIIHMEFFLGILQDSRTSLNRTFAGITIFFMISVLGPTAILKTGWDVLLSYCLIILNWQVNIG